MNIGTLTIEMLAKVTQLEQSMNQAKGIVSRAMGDIESAARSANNVLGLLGVGFSLGVSLAGTQAALAGMRKAAQDAEQASVKLAVILRNTGNAAGFTKTQIDDMADALARTTQFDDESIRNAASELLKFGNITGQVFTDALDVAAGYAAFSKTDLVSAAEDVAKALAAPESAAKLLKTAGVVLTAQQKDLMQSLIDTGKTSEAQAIIMDRLKEVYAGTAQEMNTGILKSTTGVQKAWDEMLEALGKTTVVSGVVGGGLEFVERMLNNIRRIANGDIVPRLKEILGLPGLENPYIANPEPAQVIKPPTGISDAEYLAQKKAADELAASRKKAAAEAAKAYAAAVEGSTNYITRLKEETEVVGLNAIQTKLMAAAREAAKAPLASQSMAIMTEANAWALATQAQEANVAAAKELEAQEKRRLDGYAALVSADEKSLESLKAKNDLLEFGAVAVQAMGQADLQAALDRAWAADNIDVAVIAMLERRIELSKELASEMKRGEVLEAAKEGAKSTAQAWENTARDINRSLTDALFRGFEAGKGFLENLRDTAVHMFQTLVLRPVINAVMGPIGTSIAGLTGGLSVPGMANAAGFGGGNSFNLMNIASGASSLFNAFTGGASSLISAIGTSAIGQAMGLGVAGGSVFGAGVGAGANAGTAFIGGVGSALGGTGATAAGLSGMGSMLAAAAGPLAIAAAADAIFRLIAGNKTIKGADFLTYVPVIGPMINALFGMGPKKLGTPELSGKFSDTGFDGQFEADWKRSGGIFSFGKKKGRRGLGISGEQDAALDAMVGGIADVFLDLTKVTGDAERSLNGWSMSFRHAIDTEERQKRLTDELTASIGTKLIPELTLIQQKGETLADTAARASAEFSLMNSVIDLTGQSFGAIGLASLGLRDNLVQLLGGLENAGSVLQPFFDNFYTEAERVASTGRLMNAELNKLGITTIPVTREQFRALVEAQDLSTDAGQEMFAALIQLAPAFATVTDAIGKAADDAAAEAKRIADSIQLLTTDSFVTLFDYTRYIRLAANAGVTAAQPAAPIFEAPAQIFRPSFARGINELPYDMTANLHKGERIFPAADNRELMRRLAEPNEGMQALANEIRRLREENRAQALIIGSNTAKTAKTLDRMSAVQDNWDANGQPPERT